MLKNNWWKYLGALLVLYSLLAGLLIPLGPGVFGVNPSQLRQGQFNTFEITGYKTHFKDQENSLQVWVQEGDGKEAVLFCSQKITVTDNTHATALVEIPKLDSEKSQHLLVNDDADGTIVLDNAFWFNKDEATTAQVPGAGCKVTVNVKEAAGTDFPFLKILFETIRNLYYHVPMWFAMILMLLVSMVYSIMYLSKPTAENDIKAAQFAGVGLLMGLLGIVTGMFWADHTWGRPWSNDPKQNGAAIGELLYLAYFILRRAIDDEEKRGRVSAVSNIFFFPIFMVLIAILPRLQDSLHPGSGGNPGFNAYDLDSTMRMVFYPAVIGWMLIGTWMAQLAIRYKKLEINDDE